jgi:phosphatidylglycerophosphate synthase
MSALPGRSHVPRRVLATRNAGWPRALAHGLARRGVRPNAVSIAGVALAGIAGVAFALAPQLPPGGAAILLAVAAAGVQLRLLCNLLDGMLAVEEGLRSRTGEIYNDLPDRISDVLILVGAGYSIRHLAYGPTLGWAAALVAVLTAYVRVLGGSLGHTQHFSGPMAKQHRMFTLTVCTLLAAIEALACRPPRAMAAGLAVILIGSLVTVARRTGRILGEARAR